MFSYEKLHLKCFIFCSISWTVAIRTEMSTYLFLTFSPCCAGNVPLSFFLSKMKQAKKEAIHRSISSIIHIHLSTVRSNIVVYILPKVSKGIVRLFCFWNVLFFGIFSFWNVLLCLFHLLVQIFFGHVQIFLTVFNSFWMCSNIFEHAQICKFIR